MSKFLKYLSLLILFFLPFQTRLIYSPAYLGGVYFEWFSSSLYAVEILVWIVVTLTLFNLIFKKSFWIEINQAKNKGERLIKIIRPVIFSVLFLLYWLVVPLNRDLAEYKLFLLLGAVCFAATLLINKIDVKQSFFALWGGGLLQAIIGIVQFVAQQTWESKWLGWAKHYASDLGAAVVQSGNSERWLRAYGGFNWANELGIYLAVVFLLGLWLYQRMQNEKVKILLLVGQMFIVAGLFFSFSRAALLALVMGLLVMFFQQKKKILQLLFWPVILFVVLSIIYLPLLQSRINMTNYLEARSVNERIAQYIDFKNIFISHPIFGVGPGNYVYALLTQEVITNPPLVYQPIHNIYLLFLAEWGIVGSIFTLIFVYWLFKEIWKNSREFLPLWALILTAFLFDHYLYTNYSGIILICILISLSLAKKSYN